MILELMYNFFKINHFFRIKYKLINVINVNSAFVFKVQLKFSRHFTILMSAVFPSNSNNLPYMIISNLKFHFRRLVLLSVFFISNLDCVIFKIVSRLTLLQFLSLEYFLEFWAANLQISYFRSPHFNYIYF